MKPLIQKLPLSEGCSFVCRTYKTPDFEVPWHNHPEYELILFTAGSGMSFIGNHVGTFETGDIFFLAKNISHTFQKKHNDMIASAIVIQFHENFWGADFINMTETKQIKHLLNISVQGIKIGVESGQKLSKNIKMLELSTGFNRIIQLCRCLNIIASHKKHLFLSSLGIEQFGQKDNEKIDKVFRYTINNFKNKINLQVVSSVVNMSIPAFCNYFKKSTKKTYNIFLNEIRISYSCKLLSEGNMNISSICYESGFTSLANFNKQFKKIKHHSPSCYRKIIFSKV
jgi:AraC-like DNA-binding protein